MRYRLLPGTCDLQTGRLNLEFIVGALTNVADVHLYDLPFLVRADWKNSLENSLWTLIPSTEALNTILQRLLSLRSQNLNSSWNIVSANHLINDPNRRTERTNDPGLSR